MKKFIFIVVAISISSVSLAATNKEAAFNWAREFHTAKSKTFDAMILKDPIKRKANMQNISKLRDQAEKLFGNASECHQAASGLVEVYLSAIQLAMGDRNAYITASGMAGMAWNSGQYQETCEKNIDAIK